MPQLHPQLDKIHEFNVVRWKEICLISLKHQTNHRVPLWLLLKCHVYQPTPSHCSAGPKPWLIFYIEHILRCENHNGVYMLSVGLPATLQRSLYVQHIRVWHPRAETTPPRRDSVLQNQTWTSRYRLATCADPCRLPNSMSEHEQAMSSDIFMPHLPVFVLRPLCTSLEPPTSVGNRHPDNSTVPDGRLPNHQSPVMLHVGF